MPTKLSLAPSAGAALGVAFGHSHVRVAVADLASTIIAERRREIDVDAIAVTGLVGSSSILLGWKGLDPAEALAARLGGVHVEALNDANLGALAAA